MAVLGWMGTRGRGGLGGARRWLAAFAVAALVGGCSDDATSSGSSGAMTNEPTGSSSPSSSTATDPTNATAGPTSAPTTGNTGTSGSSSGSATDTSSTGPGTTTNPTTGPNTTDPTDPTTGPNTTDPTDASSSSSGNMTTDPTDPVDPPDAPMGLMGCPFCECCDPWPISWAEVPDATHYVVRWKCSINPEQVHDVGNVTTIANVCTDIDMCNGMCAFTVGYIRVEACNDEGCSMSVDLPDIPISCGGGCCC